MFIYKWLLHFIQKESKTSKMSWTSSYVQHMILEYSIFYMICNGYLDQWFLFLATTPPIEVSSSLHAPLPPSSVPTLKFSINRNVITMRAHTRPYTETFIPLCLINYHIRIILSIKKKYIYINVHVITMPRVWCLKIITFLKMIKS